MCCRSRAHGHSVLSLLYIYIYIYIYVYICIYNRKVAPRARNDRNQSTTDRRFYSHCAPAVIDDDSAKRNKTFLQYLLRPARYVGVRLGAILATVPQRRIAPSRFFTIDSLAARGFRSASRTPIFTRAVCVRVTGST